MAGPALSVAAVALGALAAGLVAFVWPTPLGVALTLAERAQAARLVASLGGALGLLGALTARGRAAAVSGLLPLLGLCLLAGLPVAGRAHVHVGAAWLVIAVAGVIFTLAAARSSLAPALPPALLMMGVGVGLWRWPGAPPPPPAPGEGPPVVLIAVAGAPADLFDPAPATPGAVPVLHALRVASRVFGAIEAPAGGERAALRALLYGPLAGDGGAAGGGGLAAALGRRGYERVGLAGGRAARADAGFAADFDVYDSVFVDRLGVGHPLLRALGHRPLRPAAAARPARELLRVWRGLPVPAGPRFVFLQVAELGWPLTAVPPDGPAGEEAARARLEASLRPLIARVPDDAALLVVGTPLGGDPGSGPARVPALMRAPGLDPGVDPRPQGLSALSAALLSASGGP